MIQKILLNFNFRQIHDIMGKAFQKILVINSFIWYLLLLETLGFKNYSSFNLV